MTDRLARFRQYMERLDVGASATAVTEGFYVAPEGRSVADDLAARLEIKPASSHVVLGGVGTGKTTQLLVACQRLNRIEDTTAIYIDSSEHIEIHTIDSKSLLSTIYSEMLELAYARGLTIEGLATLVTERSGRLAGVASFIAEQTPHLIIVLDSLDRLIDIERFADIVTNALPELRKLGIGVVLTGPLHLMYGTARTVLDRVDRFYSLSNVDIVQQGAEGLLYLVQIVQARVSAEVCSDKVCIELSKRSGGVLRDLIALAQAAVEEAYVAGSEIVTKAHVETAGDAFGRKHLLGLNSDELEILHNVRASGNFVPTTDRDLALLHTRRVLEYRNGRTRYAVHPTIAPLLEQLKAA